MKIQINKLQIDASWQMNALYSQVYTVAVHKTILCFWAQVEAVR